MAVNELLEPDVWCELDFLEQSARLARAVGAALGDSPAVHEVRVEAGPPGREYDLTVAVETDVGVLRTALWSHARAVIFCDPSVHVANRRQLAPGLELERAAAELRARLAVPFRLESRGLTLALAPEPGVERTWTAERALFRNRTAVTREDRVLKPPARWTCATCSPTSTSARRCAWWARTAQAFLLPAATEAEGPLVSLCRACGRWAEGAHESCPELRRPPSTW